MNILRRPAGGEGGGEPRNKGNYVALASFSRGKSGVRKFRDLLRYSVTEFIMAPARTRFSMRRETKFETLVPVPFAKKYSQGRLRSPLVQKRRESTFMLHRKSDIKPRRRNVSLSRSIQFSLLRILYALRFTVFVRLERPSLLRSELRQRPSGY